MMAGHWPAVVSHQKLPSVGGRAQLDSHLSSVEVVGVLNDLDQPLEGVDVRALGAASRAFETPSDQSNDPVERLSRGFDEHLSKDRQARVDHILSRGIVAPDQIGCPPRIVRDRNLRRSRRECSF